jgi:DNA-binding XRE family transcriptional regulator
MSEDMVPWEEVEVGLNLDPQIVAEAQAELEAHVRAYRLAEVRKRQARTQREVAETMGVSQARISRIERDGLPKNMELDTLRAYVQALGGHLQLVADFGDVHLVLYQDDLPGTSDNLPCTA